MIRRVNDEELSCSCKLNYDIDALLFFTDFLKGLRTIVSQWKKLMGHGV